MDLTEILLGAAQDPLTYSILFFIYVILTVLILPFPVEIGLFNPYMNPLLLVLILALGKGAGSMIVYEIGTNVRSLFENHVTGTQLTKKFLQACEQFIWRLGYYGLFILMSTPLMPDSITLYLFSLLNPKDDGRRALAKRWFVLINVGAGTVRGMMILLIAYLFGIRLV